MIAVVKQPPLVQHFLRDSLFVLLLRFVIGQAPIIRNLRPLPAFRERLVAGLPEPSVGFGVQSTLARTNAERDTKVSPNRVSGQ